MARVLDFSPATAVRQFKALVALLPAEERLERWEARRCAPEILDRSPDWLFFSKAGESMAVARYCGPCPARVQCALRALEEDARSDYLPEGTVGGLTATDRVRILLATSAPLERSTA